MNTCASTVPEHYCLIQYTQSPVQVNKVKVLLAAVLAAVLLAALTYPLHISIWVALSPRVRTISLLLWSFSQECEFFQSESALCTVEPKLARDEPISVYWWLQLAAYSWLRISLGFGIWDTNKPLFKTVMYLYKKTQTHISKYWLLLFLYITITIFNFIHVVYILASNQAQNWAWKGLHAHASKFPENLGIWILFVNVL